MNLGKKIFKSHSRAKILAILFSGIVANFAYAEIVGIGLASIGDEQAWREPCDEVKYLDMEEGSTAVLMVDFNNTTDEDLFLFSYKVFTRPGRLRFNSTKHEDMNGFLIWNKAALPRWKVSPKTTVRYLTFYEEVGEPSSGTWTLGAPFKALADGRIFTNANIRRIKNGEDSKNEAKKIEEIRVFTEYGKTDNAAAIDDHKVIISCSRYNMK